MAGEYGCTVTETNTILNGCNMRHLRAAVWTAGPICLATHHHPWSPSPPHYGAGTGASATPPFRVGSGSSLAPHYGAGSGSLFMTLTRVLAGAIARDLCRAVGVIDLLSGGTSCPLPLLVAGYLFCSSPLLLGLVPHYEGACERAP